PGARFGLRLGLARAAGLVELGARLGQFVLRLATLLLQLGERTFGILDRLAAGFVQMLDETVGKLLQQMQRSGDRLLLRGHESASWRERCPHTRRPARWPPGDAKRHTRRSGWKISGRSSRLLMRGMQHLDQAVFQLEPLMQQLTEFL